MTIFFHCIADSQDYDRRVVLMADDPDANSETVGLFLTLVLLE